MRGVALFPLVLFLACGRPPERPPEQPAPPVEEPVGVRPAAEPGPGICTQPPAASAERFRDCLADAADSAGRCGAVHVWRAVFEDREPHRVEWRRCYGVDQHYEADSLVSPEHYLVIRASLDSTSAPIFVDSNAEEPSAAEFAGVWVRDLDRNGTDEVLLLSHFYGTGAAYDLCVLTQSAGRFACWADSDSGGVAALRPGDHFQKGPIPALGVGAMADLRAGPPIDARGSWWWFRPIYRDADANCCPSGGEAYEELRPADGRFTLGYVVRAQVDSTGLIVRSDTLRR